MIRGITILADDLTGACDAAAPFAAVGFPTTVSFGPASHRSYIHAIDMDCRDHPDDAWRVTRSCAASEGDRAIFVKVDSTLRGPIGEMVGAACRGSVRPCAIVAPAFPEQNRALIGGRLVIDGEVCWGAPSIAEALARTCRHVENVGVQSPDAAADALRQIVRSAETTTAVVVDAGDGAALSVAAAAWLADPALAILVGSSGVARRAADLLPGPRRARRPAVPGGTRGPIAVVAGSPAAATQRQLDWLEREQGPSSRVCLFRTPQPRATTRRDGGMSSARAVDRFVSWLADGHRPALVVLVGGCTARLVCTSLHATGLVLGGEIAPGVSYGRLAGGILPNAVVITKAGGFGDDDLLRTVIETAADSTRLHWNDPEEVA